VRDRLLVRKGFLYILAPPMAGQAGRTDVHVDSDGVRTAADPGARAIVRWLAAGVALVVVIVVGAIVAIRLAPGRRGSATVREADDLAPRPVADTHLSPTLAAPAAAPTVRVVPRGSVKPPPPTPPFDGDPPPGSEPLKPGLVVPDDFELPPPTDRIVPPEIAPPGLPLRTLDVPKQATPDH
jgi:hypothetical protein